MSDEFRPWEVQRRTSGSGASFVTVATVAKDLRYWDDTSVVPASGNDYRLLQTTTPGNVVVPYNDVSLRSAAGWATKAGAAAQAVAVDSSNNIWVAGRFTGTTSFGSATLTAIGNADLFLAKLSTSAAFLSVYQFGGSGAVIAPQAMAIDSNGNINVTGYFSGTANFGNGSLSSVGSQDIFLAQYSTNGTANWAKRFGSQVDAANSVAVDSSGNIWITGYFRGDLDFGDGTGNMTAYGIDSFLAKFSPAGVCAWAKNFINNGTDIGNSVAVDSSSNVVLSVSFDNAINFGGNNISWNGYRSFALAKLDPGGNHLWSQGFIGERGCEGYGVSVDANNNILATGYFGYSVNFGNGVLTKHSYNLDAFVAKFPSGGSQAPAALWSRRMGGETYNNYGNGVAIDPSGNVIVTGTFTGNGDFGGPVTIPSASPFQSGFIAKYSGSNGYVWANGFETNGQTLPRYITADAGGNTIVSGSFYGSGNFLGAPISNTPGYAGFVLFRYA